MSNTLEIIRGTVFLILGIALIGFVFWWMLKNSEDPQKFIFRSVLTVVLVLPMFWFALKTGPLAPAIAAVAGLIATFIWGSTVGGLLARPFGNLLAGGDEPPERKPVYSVAQAHRAKNHFTEALAAVRAQLEIFPNDYQGVLLLAQIYAEDFKDLPEAREVIQMFAVGNQESRVNVTNAWLQMADWYVHAGDVQNASDCFQTIIDSYPETNFSQVAGQRLAHLEGFHKANTDEPMAFRPESYRKQIGLEKPVKSEEQSDPDESERDALEERLTRHPNDVHAREKLADLYAEKKDMQTAKMHLEYLIDQSIFNAKQKAHWLNLMADLAVKTESDTVLAKEAVNRIIAMAPGTAFAEQALARLQYLTTEMSGSKKSQAVSLGSYEKNLGLKKPQGPTAS